MESQTKGADYCDYARHLREFADVVSEMASVSPTWERDRDQVTMLLRRMSLQMSEAGAACRAAMEAQS